MSDTFILHSPWKYSNGECQCIQGKETVISGIETSVQEWTSWYGSKMQVTPKENAMRKSMPPVQRAALYIAFKAGVLQQCTRHWVYFRSRKANAIEHAYRLGNYLISHFSKAVACFKGNRQLMTESINRCHQKAPDCCEQCMAVHMVQVH